MQDELGCQEEVAQSSVSSWEYPKMCKSAHIFTCIPWKARVAPSGGADQQQLVSDGWGRSNARGAVQGGV